MFRRITSPREFYAKHVLDVLGLDYGYDGGYDESLECTLGYTFEKASSKSLMKPIEYDEGFRVDNKMENIGFYSDTITRKLCKVHHNHITEFNEDGKVYLWRDIDGDTCSVVSYMNDNLEWIVYDPQDNYLLNLPDYVEKLSQERAECLTETIDDWNVEY